MITAPAATTSPLPDALTAPVPRTSGGHRHGGRPSARLAPYVFLLPYFVVAAIFFVYPLCYSAVLAFYQTNGTTSRAFVGLDNFRYILSDVDFHTALKNTLLFTICSIFLQLPLSLGLALLLNRRQGRSKAFFRLAIFAPNLVGQVFVGILFSMLFT